MRDLEELMKMNGMIGIGLFAPGGEALALLCDPMVRGIMLSIASYTKRAYPDAEMMHGFQIDKLRISRFRKDGVLAVIVTAVKTRASKAAMGTMRGTMGTCSFRGFKARRFRELGINPTATESQASP